MNWENILKGGMPKIYVPYIQIVMADGERRSAAQVHDAVKNYLADENEKRKVRRKFRDFPAIRQFQAYMAIEARKGNYEASGRKPTEYRRVF